MKKIEIDWMIVGTIAFLLLIFALPIGSSIKERSDTYKTLLSNIENKQWIEAKANLDSLGEYKNTLELSPEVNYHYYLKNADEKYKAKEYHQALNEYKNAFKYKSSDKNLENKIKEVEQICKKLDEEKRKKEELERKKAEQERLKAEREEKLKTQRMLNNVVILSQGFGYTQFGEKAVVGRIKNNNPFSVQVRADIDLKDSRGNIVGTTYTYDRVSPYSVWHFEAPTFGVYANHTFINLTIEELD